MRYRELAPLDRAEKLQQVFKVESLVVPHAEMAAVWTDDEPGVRHQQGHLPHVLRIHFIPSGTDCERFDVDPMQLIPSSPVLLIAGDHEFDKSKKLKTKASEISLSSVRPTCSVHGSRFVRAPCSRRWLRQ